MGVHANTNVDVQQTHIMHVVKQFDDKFDELMMRLTNRCGDIDVIPNVPTVPKRTVINTE